MLGILAGVAFLAPPLVCIDPGHPSEIGRGTQGKHLTEIHAAWVEAGLLRKRLRGRGIRVVLTKRTEYEMVPNRRRAEIANENRADLMVRLHCDASKGSGFTCYIPLQPGRIGGAHGPSSTVLRAGKAAGERFHAAMAKSLLDKLKDNGLKGDRATSVGAKHGALIGSIFSKVPIVLVEMVVLTNPKDEAFLTSQAGQAAMATALEQGVLAALKK